MSQQQQQHQPTFQFRYRETTVLPSRESLAAKQQQQQKKQTAEDPTKRRYEVLFCIPQVNKLGRMTPAPQRFDTREKAEEAANAMTPPLGSQFAIVFATVDEVRKLPEMVTDIDDLLDDTSDMVKPWEKQPDYKYEVVAGRGDDNGATTSEIGGIDRMRFVEKAAAERCARFINTYCLFSAAIDGGLNVSGVEKEDVATGKRTMELSPDKPRAVVRDLAATSSGGKKKK